MTWEISKNFGQTVHPSFWSPPRGGSLKIAPSTRRVNREVQSTSEQSLTTLRDELVAIFQNPSDLQDAALFIDVPPDQQRHNNLSPLSSPLFSLSDLPTPIESPPSYSLSDPFATSPNPASDCLPVTNNQSPSCSLASSVLPVPSTLLVTKDSAPAYHPLQISIPT
jgi:hypothetical protein